MRRRPALLIVGLLVALAVPMATGRMNTPWFLCEFRGDLYNAGVDILHGKDPYRPAYIAKQVQVQNAGGRPVTNFILPVYPAPALVAAVPFSLLPFQFAGTLYLACAIAALLLAMRIVGVRDMRCLAAMVLSIPVLLALIDGALTPFLVLGLAMAWRHRDGVRACAAAVAAVVVAKLFLWPLLVWLLVTRRLRALAIAAVIAAAMVVVGWALIAFHGMAGYPHMLSNLNAVESGVGVSLVGALHAVGISTHSANILALGAAMPVLAVAGWQARRPGGERQAFALAVMAALTATPIAWPNYLVLAYIPIALLSPRFSWLWLVPLLAYVAPQTQTHGHLAEMVPYLVIELVVIARTVLASEAGRRKLRPIGLDRGLRASSKATAVS